MSASRTAAANPAKVLSRDEFRELAVGAAAFVVFAGILLLSYFGVGFGLGSVDRYYVFATFNRVDGLAIGDEVQIGGIPVGKVEQMSLGPNYRARVTLSIDEDLVLPADTSVAIHTDGLFGRKFVVLEPGGDEQVLGDGANIIYTQDSLVVGELLDLIIAEGRANRAATGAKAH